MKAILKWALLTALLLQGGVAFAALNYDPAQTPPPPVLNDGWYYDEIRGAGLQSADSTYDYDFSFPTTFRITDSYLHGDTYRVYDFGTLILTTQENTGGPLSPVRIVSAQQSWEGTYDGSAFSIGAVVLAPGAHSLSVQGDITAGYPAGFYARIDAPDGGAGCLLLGTALLGLGLLERRSRR